MKNKIFYTVVFTLLFILSGCNTFLRAQKKVSVLKAKNENAIIFDGTNVKIN